jgi:hypothetical protein
VNFPSITAEEAPKLKPFIALAEKLGSFAGQLTGSSLTAVEIIYEGIASTLNTRALTQAALSGLLKPMLSEVNMVNAPIVAKERGIKVSETRRDRQGVYEGYIKIVVTMGDTTRRVAGTVFSDGRPRLIQIKDINLDAEFAPHMLYVVNEDKPGFIGSLGTILGDAKANIANFTLGRSAPGQDAIALIEVDGPVPAAVAEAAAIAPAVLLLNTTPTAGVTPAARPASCHCAATDSCPTVVAWSTVSPVPAATVLTMPRLRAVTATVLVESTAVTRCGRMPARTRAASAPSAAIRIARCCSSRRRPSSLWSDGPAEHRMIGRPFATPRSWPATAHPRARSSGAITRPPAGGGVAGRGLTRPVRR